MGKYFINEVKCGVSEGGMACGPVEGAVNVSVNVTDGDNTFWLTNSEFTGIPNFYITDEDVFDKFMDVDDEFAEFFGDQFIEEFEGISLGEYDEIFESISDNKDNPAVALIRYIILLTRCSNEEVDDVIAMAKGKYVDELDIPASDVEEEMSWEDEE